MSYSDIVKEEVEINIPALELGLTARHFLPINNNFFLTLSATINYLSVYGTYKYTETKYSYNGLSTSTNKSNLVGSGLGCKLSCGGDIYLNDNIAIGAEVGYRGAEKINIYISKDTQNLYLLTMNYSGILLQIVGKFYF